MSTRELNKERDIKRRSALRCRYRKKHPEKPDSEIEEMVQQFVDENPVKKRGKKAA